MDNEEEEDPENEEGKGKCDTCKACCKEFATFTLSHVGLLTLVILYCLAGAAIFEVLEAPYELDVKNNITKIQEAVAYQLWNMTKNSTYINPGNWSANATKILETFEREIFDAINDRGWDGEDTSTQNWTKLGALFYSIIVITTIGYGHIAPKTMWGKIVTIFYAIIGIPLMVVCLSHIGGFLANSFRVIYWKVCCYICTRTPKSHRAGSYRSNRSSMRSRSAPGSFRMRNRSIRRSMRVSQRSADSAVSIESGNSIASDPGVLRYDRRGEFYNRDMDSPTMPQTTQPRSFQFEPRPRSTRSAEPSLSATLRVKDMPVLINRFAEDFPGSTFNPTLDFDIAEQDEDVYDAEREGNVLPKITRSRFRSAPPVQSRYSPSEDELEYWDDNEEEYGDNSEDYEDQEDEYEEYDYETDEEKIFRRPVPIWLCTLLVISYIVGGAFLFHSWEGWNLLDSAYFCFITLTTIGFGDYVPDSRLKNDAETSIALCSLYLLFGIALLAMSFNLVQEQVINAFKELAVQIGILNEDET